MILTSRLVLTFTIFFIIHHADSCETHKSCQCLTIPEIDLTMLASNASYSGLTSDVSTYLTSIGKWDANDIQVLCKQAQCNETALGEAVSNIEVDINQTRDDMDVNSNAMKNIRIGIDCHANNNTRFALFTQYENLCRNNTIMKNVLEDLSIKKVVLEKEKDRCGGRSWLRRVFEDMWHKS